MSEDIQIGYPKDYYQRKERVSNQILEHFSFIVDSQKQDINFPVKDSLQNFVRKTSFRSGLSEKAIIKMIIQADSNLGVFFP